MRAQALTQVVAESDSFFTNNYGYPHIMNDGDCPEGTFYALGMVDGYESRFMVDSSPQRVVLGRSVRTDTGTLFYAGGGARGGQVLPSATSFEDVLAHLMDAAVGELVNV